MPAAIPVIASVAGSVISSNASKKAAGAQADAAQAGLNEQGRQFDLTREDQAPFRQAGVGAINQLNMLLGNSGGGQTEAQIRNRLMPQFNQQSTQSPNMAGWQLQRSANADGGGYWISPQGQVVPFEAGMTDMLLAGGNIGGSGTTLDEAGLNAAVQAELAAQNANKDNPLYGSLTRDVTEQDIRNDPVFKMSYDFGMRQGNQALERAAAASGRLGTGRFVKDATQFATDYSSTKAGEAWNRTWGGRQNKFNMLAPVAGIGQTSVAQTGQAGMNYAKQTSNLLQSQGNSRASGYMGQSNALTDGLNNIYGIGKQQGWWGGSSYDPSAQHYGNMSGDVPTLTDFGGGW